MFNGFLTQRKNNSNLPTMMNGTEFSLEPSFGALPTSWLNLALRILRLPSDSATQIQRC